MVPTCLWGMFITYVYKNMEIEGRKEEENLGMRVILIWP